MRWRQTDLRPIARDRPTPVNLQARERLEVAELRHHLAHKMIVKLRLFVDGRHPLHIAYIPSKFRLVPEALEGWIQAYDTSATREQSWESLFLAWLEDLNNELLPEWVRLHFIVEDHGEWIAEDTAPGRGPRAGAPRL